MERCSRFLWSIEWWRYIFRLDGSFCFVFTFRFDYSCNCSFYFRSFFSLRLCCTINSKSGFFVFLSFVLLKIETENWFLLSFLCRACILVTRFCSIWFAKADEKVLLWLRRGIFGPIRLWRFKRKGSDVWFFLSYCYILFQSVKAASKIEGTRSATCSILGLYGALTENWGCLSRLLLYSSTGEAETNRLRDVRLASAKDRLSIRLRVCKPWSHRIIWFCYRTEIKLRTRIARSSKVWKAHFVNVRPFWCV